MATAMPRWRVNQCEISAINGAKAAELPTPITPYAMAYCHAATEKLELTYPNPSITEPIVTGTTIPNRSASRPISAPPNAKPLNTNVKGSDAVARSTPKSAWTAGNATTADHIPMHAIVLRRRDMVSLSQWYGDPIIVVS